MYYLIIWACLITSPDCELGKSIANIAQVYSVKNRLECEAKWIEMDQEPDPPGTKYHHICKPVQEDI